MVLINDKKYSCATCIKGHRSSNCTHTDRSLFEIKKKGRPVTQCEHCRKLRQTKQLHIKCECGSKDKDTSGASSSGEGSASVIVTRKGVPGDKPTFPNGLKDVHDLAAAADALSGLSNRGAGSSAAQHTQIKNLLNPCHCNSGGKCKCCKPLIAERKIPESSSEEGGGKALGASSHTSVSGSRTPAEQFRTRNSSTENLSEMFWQKATTEPSGLPHTTVPPIRMSNYFHPAHTSPHVHKTKLFSPYDVHTGAGATQLRRISDIARGSSLDHARGAHRGHPTPSYNGTTTPPISLPPLNPAFLVTADTQALLPAISFPTQSSVHLSGCTCGDDCSCPGCATHMNVDAEGGGGGGGGSQGVNSQDVTMGDAHACPSSCTSCFDCSSSAYLPTGLATVNELINAAAAAIPPPRHSAWRGFEQLDQPNSLDPHNLHVMPPSALHDDKAAEAMGFMRLKPLQCCNGRCQCEAGQCSCSTDCCGCCLRCECAAEGNEAVSGSIQPALLESMPSDESASHQQVRPKEGCCGSSGPSVAVTTAAEPLALIISDAQPTPPLPPIGNIIELPVFSSITPSVVDQPSSDARAPSISRSSSTGAVTKATRLVRAASMTSGKPVSAKASILPHQPRPILPRPPSAKDGDILNKTISTSHGKIHRLVIPHTVGAGPRDISPRASSSQSHRAFANIHPPAHSDVGIETANHDKSQDNEPSANTTLMVAASDPGVPAQSVKEEPVSHLAANNMADLTSSYIDEQILQSFMETDGQPNYFDAFDMPEAVPNLDDLNNMAFDEAYLGAEMPDLTPNEIEAWLEQVLTQQDLPPDVSATPNATQ